MKNKRTFILFTLAVAFGLAAAFLAQNVLQVEPVQVTAAEIKVTPVVVAKIDLSVSSALSDQNLDIVEWPTEYLPKGSFQSTDELEHRVLRRAIAAGEVVQEMSLLENGAHGGLVAVISPDKRAISVEVDATIGVAGFITPGSYVDVIATLKRLEWTSKQPYSKAILQNVKVLAIDQKLEEVGAGEPELVNVVTLEVTPDQSEQLTYSAHEGKLQLALRSPQDQEIVRTSGAFVGGMLGKAPTKRRESVQIVKGTKVSSKSY